MHCFRGSAAPTRALTAEQWHLKATDKILIFTYISGHHQSSISASPREFVVLYSPSPRFGERGPGGEGWDCYVQVSGSVICFGFQDNAKHRDNE